MRPLTMNSLLKFTLIALFTLTFMSCKDDDDDNTVPAEPDNGCYVQLFDGDNYKDDHITIKGAGEFRSLDSLPGANKNWNDEADSFKAGKNTVVTFWTKTNFEGDSIVYKKGAKMPSVDEPSSMKIRCK